ncbi:hypothetical protein [Porphyrobacter sp. YT40]|uniref:hypothetical protein n=1 Tax=Porphyrobacter sp. YT40 TaxID=2547601 RepID=UPI001142124D|nr:hypothetical protein [Porphyrobacter sp. YT40]QDH36426.1 hypothetical protein E2E27_18465 [Porphyrobacter sp. YT40]
MKHEVLIAWTSLYIGVGCMALICAALAIAVTADELLSGRWRVATSSWSEKALLLPKSLIRWQINYLKGAPVILVIALYYAWSVGFSVFWDL